MNTPQGYEVARHLHRRKGVLISRAVRVQDNHQVILKQLDPSQCGREDPGRLQHEYELLKSLKITGILRPLELISTNNTLVGVFEDSGAIPLRQFISEQQMEWHHWIPVAIRLSELIGRLHEARVIHKQISPDHVLLHPTTLQPVLIGFDYCTRLSREQPNWHAQALHTSALAYIAPEQTGRINRTIDYRTDYYSLGATLYELMTGRPPFIGGQDIELVHNQIARPPEPPSRINPSLPEMVSRIILKLLAKDAAQRYQSTVGLIHDLRRCQKEFNQHSRISTFELAEQDIAAQFQIPQRLYGREAVLQQLRGLMDRAVQGKQTLVLISGYAGIGKSSLVHELRQYVNELGGHFSSGKFDQYRRNRPYFAIVQALQSLVRQLLTEPEEAIQQLRIELNTSMRGQGQMLLKLIPELELIIGPQPSLPAATPAEEQRRFSRLFIRVLDVLATPERPMLLFLDDLHWADQASLQLIETLVESGESAHLLLMGSFRDQELEPAPQKTLDRLRALQKTVIELQLGPLDLQQVSQLLADTLRRDVYSCQSLARICMRKTQGNPFFLSQFLYALHEEGLISFREQRWQWDENAIEAREMTDNVVALMVSKIQRLPKATQRTLPLAASIGGSFNLRTLSVVSKLLPSEAVDALWPAMTEGLIVPLDDQYRVFEKTDQINTRYRFIHDRVQQAAYSLIPEQARESLHLEVGRQLWRSLSADEIDNRIFEITNHLNLASALIEDPQEHVELAQLNLRAGTRARESAAFDVAMDYLKRGLGLLPEQSWQHHYSLTLALHSLAAEVANIRGEQALMDNLILAVEQHAQNLLDHVRVHEVRIQSQVANNQFREALSTALTLLHQLGVELPEHPTPFQNTWIANRVKWLLKRTPPERVPDLKSMKEPTLLAAMPLLTGMFGIVKFSSSGLRPMLMAKQVELTLTYGLSNASALAFAGYGGVLCGKMNDIDQGYRLGLLALELDKRMPDTAKHHRTMSLFNSYIRHYREPLAVCRDSLLDAHQQALDCGDMEWGAYALAAYIQYAFPLCQNLDQLQPKLEKDTRLLRQYGQKQSLQYSLFILQTMENMRGQNNDPTRLDGRFYREDRDLAELTRENHRTAICLHHFYKALLSFIFGDMEAAYHHSEISLELRDSISGTFTVLWIMMINALSIIQLLPSTSILTQPARLKTVRKAQRYIRKLARFAPDNRLHHYELLSAELLRSKRRYTSAMNLYEKAIEHAHRQGLKLDQAMACELAGRFYQQWQKPGIARTYLLDAYRLYAELGAQAKLQQMKTQYDIDLPSPHPMAVESRASSTEQRRALDNQTLDISSVINASQAISDEIVLEKLLSRLMRLAIQNAGAQRAILVMYRRQQLFIEAETRIDEAPALFTAIPLTDGADMLPLSIINFVARTKDPVVLGNAVEHQMFQSDGYIRQQQPRSLLTLPILYHSELTGILYLEHRESRDVFSRERLKTLQILSAQAAISIENAKLYKSLEQSEREYRSLFENASEGIFRIAPDGRLISANPALISLLGYDACDQFLHEATDLIMDCFIDPEQGRQFLATLQAGQRVKDLETRWRRQDGGELHVSISAHRIADEHDAIRYYEGSLTDIGERKAKELAELARQKAEAASEAKSQFLATMSHEIRTPMNGILGMAQLLKRSTMNPSQRDQVESIYQSGQSLLTILNDVLDFTKIEAGQMTFEAENFELPQLLKRLKTLLTPMAREKKIDLILRLDPKLPQTVQGDARALNQVLMNLCTNALKFTDAGYVVLKARPLAHEDAGHLIRFEVEDSGIGIPPEAHERIFQHFSQADSSITRRYGGTGLGLSICRKLVEKQQGRIGFNSQAGSGSLFWVELPYQAADQTTAPEPPTESVTPSEPKQTLSILLVEDTPINQEVTASLLRAEGHHVSIADDGYTALSMHNDNDYDLVLMDIHLPDMDGLETTRRLRAHRDADKAKVTVVALTAAVTRPEIRRCKDAGIETVLSKPLQFEELEQVVRAVGRLECLPPPSVHSSADTEGTLDIVLLNQHRRMLGEKRMLELLDTMGKQCESLLRELEQAGTPQRASVLHKLAGASANFGLQQMAERCRKLETEANVTTEQLAALNTLWAETLQALSAFKTTPCAQTEARD
ncbi:MAG: PAS sensor protein [Oceanospirillaceae bacterium]|nr:PAS sensor protein [Oceanospirillaceae bacterium]